MSHHQHLDPERARTVQQAAAASFIGNFIEWFDYASYGYLAVIIGSVFFPESDPTTQLLSTFGVFAVSFILRPVGAVIWGAWGDRKGRKWALSWSILIMSGSTFIVGCLPGYHSIGVWAAVLLVAARMGQGFSASGEYAGASTFLAEFAPPSRRGIYVSLVPASTATGLLLGSLFVSGLFAVLDDAAMITWGWRLPFLLAGPLGLIGRYIRMHLEDSPTYSAMRAEVGREGRDASRGSTTPLKELLRDHRSAVLTGFGVSCLNAVGFYLLLSYMPSYLATELHVPETRATLATSVTLCFYIGLILLMGHVSDALGRKRVMASACCAFIVLTLPLFHVMSFAPFGVLVVCEIVFAFMLTLNDGTLASFLTEIFPTEVRYSGFALSFNLANTLLGGTAPFVATWLISWSHNSSAPAYYLVAVAAIALIALLTSHVRIRRNLAASSGGDASTSL